MSKSMLAAILATLLVTHAEAAEMKLLIGGSMATAFQGVGAEFQRSTGNRIDFTFDTTGALLKRLRDGDKADIVMVSAAGMDALENERLIRAGTRIDLARALIGVSMKKGGQPPDIATADAFKATLMKARAIAYADPKSGGTSGIYFAGLLEKMGIAGAVNRKTVFGKQGADVARAVAEGRADLGITFISEMISNQGVSIVGPLPDALQSPTVYVAAIPAASENPEEARAFLAAMTSAAGAAAIRDSGLEPLSRP